MKLRFALSTLLITAISFVNIASVHAAGSASFALSPSGGSYAKGSTINMTISESSPVTVNSVQADINYDASKLSYAGFSSGSFPCPIVQAGAGSLSLGCNVTGDGVAGGVTVGTVRFTVLAGSGSTTVSLASSSLIVHPTVIPGTPPTTGAEDVWNHALVGASYSFTTPAPVQPIQPNTGGSNSNLSSPAGNTNKTPSASKTTTSGANNATNQTTSTDAAKTSGDDTSVLGTEKNNTPASYVASLQKNAASNPVWLIVIAILVVLAGAAAIYARRNPRQFAAATSAAALAAGSAKNATLSVFKKAEAKPVAKKSATKAVIAKKPATKKKATAKKTPVKKAKVPKKS